MGQLLYGPKETSRNENKNRFGKLYNFQQCVFWVFLEILKLKPKNLKNGFRAR